MLRLISRADAVFECCAEYVTDQIENGAKPINTCSIITFNDTFTQVSRGSWQPDATAAGYQWQHGDMLETDS